MDHDEYKIRDDEFIFIKMYRNDSLLTKMTFAHQILK